MSAGDARPHRPGVGEQALDTATGRIGIVRDILLYDDPSKPKESRPKAVRTAFLRPIGGGEEWSTRPACLEFPPDSGRPNALVEQLAARRPAGACR